MEDTMPEYVGDFTIRSVARSEDAPLEVDHSLLAQCEMDSLRAEVRSLVYNLSLAQGEIARLRDMVENPNGYEKFLGFPFRYVDESDDDCRRFTYQIFYCGHWRDVNTCALYFSREEAIMEIIKMIKREGSKMTIEIIKGHDNQVADFFSSPSNTPETDSMVEESFHRINFPTSPVPAEFARRLERERDDAREAFVIATDQMVQAQCQVREARELAQQMSESNQVLMADVCFYRNSWEQLKEVAK